MKKIIYIFSALILSVSVFNTVYALTVSPAKIEVTGDPGNVLSGEIELFNEQNEPKTFFSSYENFEPSGESGAPYFVGANGGLATWIETQNEVVLQPGDRITVPYKITIPQNAAPGGYFAAIFFGNQPPSSTGGSEVTIGGKIGILILLRVSGDIEEKGGLLSFESKDKKRFFTSLPISFEYKLNNLGGDRVVPAGEVKIKNSFWLTSAKLLANKNEGSVLPNSSRKFEVVWDKKSPAENLNFFQTAKDQLKNFHLGFYTAKLDITWGISKQVAKDSFVFFVFPWQLLSIVLVVLIVIGFFGIRGLRRYNNWIISQARGSFEPDSPASKKRATRKTSAKRVRVSKDE